MKKLEYLDKVHSDIGIFNSGKYIFDNPWDMECCTTPYSYKTNGYSPNGDPEWIYQYARMEWLYKYIYLYNETCEPTLLDSYKEKIFKFYKTNTITKSIAKSYTNRWANSLYIRLRRKYIYKRWVDKASTYRTLDTAIRNYYVLLSFDKVFELQQWTYYSYILKRVKEDMTFTISNLREFDLTSNWGIIIVCSYCSCKLMLFDDDIDEPLELLKTMLDNQVCQSGSHIECSTMYHNIVLLYLTRLVYRMHISKYNVPLFLEDAAVRMFQYSIALAGGDFHQVPYGDSDVTELSSLFLICSHVLKVNAPIKRSDNLDLILLSEFNINLSNINFSIDDSNVRFHVLDNGIAFYSSPKNKLIVFNEKSDSGHKHFDNGSFVLYRNLKPILVDSGRYTYHDICWRKYFKSPQVHNMAIVDGATTIDPFAVELTKFEKDGISVIVSRYKDALSGLNMLRCYGIIYDNSFLIADIVIGKGKHLLETFYTPSDDYNFVLNSSNDVYLYSNFGHETYSFLNPCGLTPSIVDGYISSSYNSKRQVSRLCFRKYFDDSIFAYILIDDNQNNNNIKCKLVQNQLVIKRNNHTTSIKLNV